MAAYKAMSSSSLVSRVVEPTKDELEGFNSLSDILKWARIDGSPLTPGSKGFSLLDAIGADAATDLHEVANVDPADFPVALEAWRIGGPAVGLSDPNPRPASAIDKGRARAFHTACRIASGLIYSTADTEAWEWQRDTAAAAAAAAALANANVGTRHRPSLKRCVGR